MVVLCRCFSASNGLGRFRRVKRSIALMARLTWLISVVTVMGGELKDE